MKKLWQKKNEKLNELIEAFETKGDLLLDQKLVRFDVQASLAHAEMLCAIGIVSEQEFEELKIGLNEILALDSKDSFQLESGDEDIHTKIENYLTDTHGAVGKKIHTARSRNDQVLTALRLYEKEQLKKIEEKAEKLAQDFQEFEKVYGHISMPGYTHMQKAMPASIKMWANSFSSALFDDVTTVHATFQLIDQSPLGSAAGFGLPITIHKEQTAGLMHFSRVQENPMYCQHSRGKFEASILSSLVQILMTVNKFASDLLLFTTQEYGFFTLCETVTTGSSIMPQKKNLDVAELLRSKVHIVLGHYVQIVSLSSNLISGYNRDIQDTKKPLMESLELTADCLEITGILLGNIIPNEKKLQESMTAELFATERALNLVLAGESFRDAYQKVGNSITKEDYEK